MKQRPHLDTNRVWRSATTLIEANSLPLSHTANHRQIFSTSEVPGKEIKEDEILTRHNHHELPEVQEQQVQTRYHCHIPVDPTSNKKPKKYGEIGAVQMHSPNGIFYSCWGPHEASAIHQSRNVFIRHIFTAFRAAVLDGSVDLFTSDLCVFNTSAGTSEKVKRCWSWVWLTYAALKHVSRPSLYLLATRQ